MFSKKPVSVGQKRYYNDSWQEEKDAQPESKRPKVEDGQLVVVQSVQPPQKPKQIDAKTLEAQARFFALQENPQKKKKKAKAQKKFEEIKKMLETSTKFYQEVKKPSFQNCKNLEKVLNATKVLIELAGSSSINDGSKAGTTT